MINPFIITENRPAARIQEAFLKEAEKRNLKDYEDWVRDELEVLWKVTCQERAKLGKGPVSLKDVERAESAASGHIDYCKKVALNCEDLVYDRF